jgi:biotin carboxylase
MSGYVSPTLLNLVDESVRTEFVASVNHDSADPYKTVVSLASLPFNIIGVISGSELGVEVTDFLTEQLGVPSNGTEMTNARRDKYQMGEAVRRAGVRAVKQARVQSWSELEAFLEDLRPNPFKLVLKPIRSAGSDNVYLCESSAEAKQKFEQIIGSQNQLGFQNEAVVAQEFLDGKEYVVDGVSRDGKHKIIAIWEYDKRTFNGFNFVYFGMGSVSGFSPEGSSLASYMCKVLDSLNIRHGASHGEVILTKSGPCLVEVGARCHGCEGTFMPLADRVWGYNQVGALVSATLSQTEFDSLPDVCGDEKEFGFKVDFVSNREGKLIGFKHLEDMEKLPSFMRFDVMPKIGDEIHLTIDCFTAVGSCTLVHKNMQQVLQDHAAIRQYELDMFIVEKHDESQEKKHRPKKAGP